MNYGAKDFLKARILARRSNRIAADRLLNEPSTGVSSLDLQARPSVVACLPLSTQEALCGR